MRVRAREDGNLRFEEFQAWPREANARPLWHPRQGVSADYRIQRRNTPDQIRDTNTIGSQCVPHLLDWYNLATALLPSLWEDYCEMVYLYWKSPLCIENRDDTTIHLKCVVPLTKWLMCRTMASEKESSNTSRTIKSTFRLIPLEKV